MAMDAGRRSGGKTKKSRRSLCSPMMRRHAMRASCAPWAREPLDIDTPHERRASPEFNTPSRTRAKRGGAVARGAGHRHACARGLYPPHAAGEEGTPCYMATNADEYWAEGTQSWFDATMRRDVNAGVNCRARLQAHDPALALLLAHAYGEGAWRFTHEVRPETRERWIRRQEAGE